MEAQAVEAVESAEPVEAPEGAEVETSEGSDEAHDSGHSSQVAPPGSEDDERGEASGEEEAPSAEPESYEVKVDGEVKTFTLDELKQHASAGVVATQRFQEAAKIRKDAETTLQRVEQALMENPAGVIQHLGPDGVESAVLGLLESPDPQIQQAINRAVEASQAGPEAKRQRELEREVERLRKEREQFQSQKQQREAQAYQQKVQQTFQQHAGSALEAAGIKATDATVRELAGFYNQSMGDAPLSAETLAQAAKLMAEERLPALSTAYLGSLPPEKLSEILGKDRLKQLTQSQIDQVKADRSAPPPSSKPKQRTNGQTQQRLTLEQIRREREKQRHGF